MMPPETPTGPRRHVARENPRVRRPPPGSCTGPAPSRLARASPPGGVNFAVICRNGTAVTLVLSEPCNLQIAAEIPLDPAWNRTGDHWHARVSGLPDEFCYGYRVDGPEVGPLHRYDPTITLLDPAARALSCGRPWGTFVGEPMPRRSMLTRGSDAERSDEGINPRIPRERHDPLRAARPGVHGATPRRGWPRRAGARSPGWPRRSRYSQGSLGVTADRAAADRRVRRERLPIRQPADRRAAPQLTGGTTPSPTRR